MVIQLIKIDDSSLGLCKLEKEIQKEAKNVQKCDFSAFLDFFKLNLPACTALLIIDDLSYRK